MRWAILVLLLFEPIIIDEVTYNQITAGAHANMRGTEYDLLMGMFNQLEQKAVKDKAVNDAKQKQAPSPLDGGSGTQPGVR
jgi:hypothetical protein